MKEVKLNQTYYKVLITIKALNDLHYYPFGTLISFTSKKVCRLTMMLYRYGYIGRIFDTQTKKLYFSLTDKGIEATDAFLKTHKKPFARRNKNVTPTIVKID